MEIKNTYKSKIIEKKIDSEIYFASINNDKEITDTIQKQINKRFIQFYFCLEGNITFQFSDLEKRNLSKNSSYMVFNPNKNLPLNLNIPSGAKLAVLVVSAQKMEDLFITNNLNVNILMKSFEINIYEENSISLIIKYIISQMENYQLKKEFEKLYLSGKMYELLIHYFSEKEDNQLNFPFILNEELAMKIKIIREILISQKINLPKIQDLADKVNLSPYKLQEAFKKMYHTTIYGYYLNYKLDYAKNELLLNKKKVKEIGYEIGYENISHFIEAFKKKFNITPKQFILQFNKGEF